MLKSLLLLLLLSSTTISLPASVSIIPLGQPSNAVTANYSDYKDIKVIFSKLSESVTMGTAGSPGSRSSESGKKTVFEWSEYANHRSDFIAKYPKVKLELYSKLGETGVLGGEKVDGYVEFATSELFGGVEYKKYISSYSQASGSFKALGDTYIIASSTEKEAYIKIGCYVEAQWDNKTYRDATAEIKLKSIVFTH